MVSALEFRRKFFHICFGLLLMVLYMNDSLSSLSFFLLLIVGSIICILSRRYRIPGIWWFLLYFERPSNLASFPGKGAWFFILGFWLSSVLFEKNVVLAAMSVLVIGDAISHIIGVHFGQIKHPFSNTKFIEGHVIGALASAFAASFFVPMWIGLAGSIAGMFMEGVDILLGRDPVDDNLIIPLVAGVTMTLLL